jgi:SAM-dependent methyltransferase
MWRLVVEAVSGPDFRHATFTGPARGTTLWRRVVVRPVELRGERFLQFSYFGAKKHIAQNYRSDDVLAQLDELAAAEFPRIHLSTHVEEIDIQVTRKGKVLVGRGKATTAAPLAHNRVKDVPLPEGKADRLLQALGILTERGSVRPSMRPKFTQINELLKQLTHVLGDAGLRDLGRPLEILDCGCGSSFLTLAVHHYLNDVLALPARIVGIDVNAEVIRKSMERSAHLGAPGVEFACARIGAVDVKPDIVLALHACDTATDDALAQAIRSEAKLILSVPCCHHHLNDRIRAADQAQVLRPLLRHGILKQRSADLVTDAFRALILRIMGYRTDVVEFIDLEHTARNLLIRAWRGLPLGEAPFVKEYLALRSFWGVTPYLEEKLAQSLQSLLTAPSG